jgi:hypothetical protein
LTRQTREKVKHSAPVVQCDPGVPYSKVKVLSLRSCMELRQYESRTSGGTLPWVGSHLWFALLLLNFLYIKKIFFKRTNAFLSLGYQKYPTPRPLHRAKIRDNVDYYDIVTVDIMELAYQRRTTITKTVNSIKLRP